MWAQITIALRIDEMQARMTQTRMKGESFIFLTKLRRLN